jgi:hypothetical protein
MSDLKPGSRWKSAVCSAEFVVVRPPQGAGELQCGGVAVRPQADPAAPSGAVPEGEGSMAGKRYFDEVSGIEVLVSKPGPGSLGFDGRALTRKDAKPLPASD